MQRKDSRGFVRKPQYELCHKQPGVPHIKGYPWECRTCHKKACGHCAHRFGSARSPVVLDKSKPQERIFTCQKCCK